MVDLCNLFHDNTVRQIDQSGGALTFAFHAANPWGFGLAIHEPG